MPLNADPVIASDLLLEQQIVYSYDRPIEHLRHRLVVIPREEHGAQRRTGFGVVVSGSPATVTFQRDAFSNCVAHITAGAVRSEIEFSIWSVVTPRQTAVSFERGSQAGDSRFLQPTALTEATNDLAAIAREFSAMRQSATALGEMACRWASTAISYGFGVTDVHTTAAEAIAGGTGVCQDYAHIMLAVCRAAGVPARYVSGHLTGEGGSHAWVEVLQPCHSGGTMAVGFDPTHDRPVDQRYLTVAIGRDYSDVAPTSGTFHGSARGELKVSKHLSHVRSQDGPLFERPAKLSVGTSLASATPAQCF